jgi:hypothetical protein
MAAAASETVLVGFTALEMAVALLFVAGCAFASRGKEGAGAAAVSGLLARFDARPPPLLGLFVAVFGISCAIGFSPMGERLARGLPISTPGTLWASCSSP